MSQKVQEVMSSDVATLQDDQTIIEAAKIMRDRNVGDVIVCNGDTICGIVTDRDIVVRALAEGMDTSARLGDICSRDLATLGSTDTVEQAIALMRERAVRRLPIVENERPVGVVSLGDLAADRDPQSVLGAVSTAPPSS